jgi:hypothetical protein
MSLILSPGQLLAGDGDVWRVLDIGPVDVTLVSRSGAERTVPIADAGAMAILSMPPQPYGGETSAHLLDNLPTDVRAVVDMRLADVLEVLTGFQGGDPSSPLLGEPRPDYDPGARRLGARISAKAVERGVSEKTVRRQLKAYREFGAWGLVDERSTRPRQPLGDVDERWIAAAREILDEGAKRSIKTIALIIDAINLRATRGHGMPPEQLPSTSTARRVLDEIDRGKHRLRGPTKRRGETALRPVRTFGSLHATRPGQYVSLDTTRLDVFGLCHLTLRWVPLELSVAMDVMSRTICGLRLAETTKHIDAALLLYETITPDSWARTDSGVLPYVGAPEAFVVDEDTLTTRLTDPPETALPGVAPEAVIMDHGKIYFCPHTLSLCERLGADVQPARKATPTDKGPHERFFRTLSEQLLGVLPAFKGRDLSRRGESPEGEACLFTFEIEQMIRDWIARCYHRTPHRGLRVPDVPGLDLTPLEALEIGRARSGGVRIPMHRDLVYDFLPTKWRTIQPYGVELNGERYDAPVLDRYRHATSNHLGRYAGKWPIRYDPDDIRAVFFQDPDTKQWHTLHWRYASEIIEPMSEEALAFAKRRQRERGKPDDTRSSLQALMEEWQHGDFTSKASRRMAARHATQRMSRMGGDAALVQQGPLPQPEPELDDDPLISEDDDLDALDPDYYDDAFETL